MVIGRINQELETTAQSQTEIVGWQASLQAAMFNAIGESDVTAIVQKQVEKAKAGDTKAAAFIVSQVLGSNRPVKINQTLVVGDVESAARLTRK